VEIDYSVTPFDSYTSVTDRQKDGQTSEQKCYGYRGNALSKHNKISWTKSVPDPDQVLRFSDIDLRLSSGVFQRLQAR